jgi:hypothetical protein
VVMALAVWRMRAVMPAVGRLSIPWNRGRFRYAAVRI